MRAERTAIWSVPEGWQTWFFILFSVQLLSLIGFVVWYEVSLNGEDSWPETILAIGRGASPFVILIAADSWPETILAIGRGASPFVILIAAESFILTEVAEMISERYLEKRYRDGRADEYQRWVEWNNRRLAAEAAGEPFDEPPPSQPPPRRGN